MSLSLSRFADPEVPNLLPASTPPSPAGGGFLSNFLSSALRSGTSEMVGLPGQWTEGVTGVSPEANDAWRQQNFVSSLASQMLGAAPAYVASAIAAPALAGTSAAARIAPWAARVFSQEALLTRPVATTAGRAILETVPVEAARLAFTPLLGGDLEKVAGSAGLDLAGAGVLGAGFGIVRGIRTGAGRVEQDIDNVLSTRLPEYNITAPKQERLATLQDNLAAQSDPEVRGLMERQAGILQQSIRAERGSASFTDALEGADPKKLPELLRVFASSARADQGDTLVRKFVRSPSEGFDSVESWNRVAKEVGLPDNWERSVQYPRVVETTNPAAAGRIAKAVRDNLEDVGDGWFVRREANQDLFIIAKRLDAPEPTIAEGMLGPPAPTHPRWFMARTNEPEKFIPTSPVMRRAERLSRFVGAKEDDAFRKGVEALPVLKEDSVAKNVLLMEDNWKPVNRTDPAKWDVMENMPAFVQTASKEFAPIAEKAWTATKNVIAPRVAQFNKAPLASWMTSAAKSVFDNADGAARRLLYGELPADASLLRSAIGKEGPVGGLKEAFDKAIKSEGDMRAVLSAWGARREGLEMPEAISRALADLPPEQQERVGGFLRRYGEVGRKAFNELQATEKLTGHPVTTADETYEFPHVWAGDWRQRVLDEKNRVLFVAGGRTKAEAEKLAKDAAARIGGRVEASPARQTSRDVDKLLAARLFRDSKKLREEGFNPTRPMSTKERIPTGIGGFVGDMDGPIPTSKELWDIISNDIEGKYKRVASMLVKNRLEQKYSGEIRARYGVEVANAANKRLEDMVGRQGPVAKWVNKQSDKVLAPFIGTNSASKVASAANNLEAHFNLGLGNIANTVGNAMAFLQTVAPRVALTRQMLARGEASRAYALYDYIPLMDQEGVKGAAAAISPVKLARAAWRSMKNPTKEDRAMFMRAARESVLAPKMYAEFLTDNSTISQTIKRLQRGEEPMMNTMRLLAGVNQSVPMRIEEFTRAHAFMVGVRMAEAMGAKGEAQYQIAKQFTAKSMYGSTQADRPRAFTGPTGMVFGQFKNWMFHYIADWGLYGREALKGNYQALLWATGSAGAVGGVGAIPLYGAIDGFQRFFSNKPLVEKLYENTGVERGDAVFYGLPGLLGVSLQNSASGPLTDPVHDITQMFNIATLSRVGRIVNAAGEGWRQWANGGMNPLESERFWDMTTYALGPRPLYKALAQVQDGQLISPRNGRPILDGVTGAEWALNILNLPPTRISRGYEVASTLWDDERKRSAATAAMSDTFHRAMQMGDSNGMNRVLAGAIESNLDVSSVMKGAVQRFTQGMKPQMPMEYLRLPGAIERMQSMGLFE